MVTELQLNYAAFNLWLQSEGGDNYADLEKAKRVLPIILDECVSDKQRDYMMAYFVGRMSICEIAQLYKVAPSTVSRTIKRGVEKSYSYLRFVSPLFVKAPKPRAYLKNGRVRNRAKEGR